MLGFDGHFPWTSGQLGKAPGPWPSWIHLGTVGEGWTRLLGSVRPGFQQEQHFVTLEHFGTLLYWNLDWLLPESAVFVTCSFTQFLAHFGHSDTFCS